MELVCKPKEVAVFPDRSDLTSPLQTRDRTRRVRTFCLLIYVLNRAGGAGPVGQAKTGPLFSSFG